MYQTYLAFPPVERRMAAWKGLGEKGFRGVAIEKFKCLEDLFDGFVGLMELVCDWGWVHVMCRWLPGCRRVQNGQHWKRPSKLKRHFRPLKPRKLRLKQK